MSSFLSRREEEKKMVEEGRMPPGQSLTQKFPVLHYGPVPYTSLSNWDFRVWGEVEEPASWTWEEFSRFPTVKVKMDIHCVTKWSKFDTEWEGVSVRWMVEEGLIKPKASAKHVLQHAEFGYTTNTPMDVVLADNFLLATHFNGEPLDPDHGFPLRGVVGKIVGDDETFVPYLWKGAKWLRGLEFMTQDKMGFWEQAGYHNNGDVWKEERLR